MRLPLEPKTVFEVTEQLSLQLTSQSPLAGAVHVSLGGAGPNLLRLTNIPTDELSKA
jgi:hypothetical protein